MAPPLDDPESFLAARPERIIVLDEIHRLADPAEFLKIAADHYPRVRILAIGSSTLGASDRFRDTLAGRKTEVWLTPTTLATCGNTWSSANCTRNWDAPLRTRHRTAGVRFVALADLAQEIASAGHRVRTPKTTPGVISDGE